MGEGGVGADEYIVFDARSIPQLNAVLDGDAVANDHVVFDEHLLADIAVAADRGAFKDMRIRPNARAFADSCGFDDGLLMLKIAHEP